MLILNVSKLPWDTNKRDLAAKNTTEQVVEIRPEKNFFQARTGFKPMTSAIPVQRSTN